MAINVPFCATPSYKKFPYFSVLFTSCNIMGKNFLHNFCTVRGLQCSSNVIRETTFFFECSVGWHPIFLVFILTKFFNCLFSRWLHTEKIFHCFKYSFHCKFLSAQIIANRSGNFRMLVFVTWYAGADEKNWTSDFYLTKIALYHWVTSALKFLYSIYLTTINYLGIA